MKRIVLASCLVLTAMGLCPAAEKVFKIGFSTNMEDPRALAALQFKEEIERESGGSLSAELYPSGQLGGDAALIEAMALDSGTVDIIISDASNFATYEPKMGISALPFSFRTYEDAWEFMDSPIEEEVEQLLIDHNMRVLSRYCNGFRCVTTSKGVVDTPADMNGLLIRTPENPVIMATMRALGANPQPLAFSELYMALQQGTYDAQENPIPVIYNNKLFEVQKYLSITNHIYSGMCFTIAESVWETLSEAEQKIVAAAAVSSSAYNRELNKKMADEFIGLLGTSGGMTIHTPDLAPFMAATQKVLEDGKSVYGESLLQRLEEWKAER
ncbi:MAG: TRAP transporter substrate-binding protein [Planctomycetes bacterium]|nr:TRAP transporter substrate-binding protein [Planctomycetota bacterium]